MRETRWPLLRRQSGRNFFEMKGRLIAARTWRRKELILVAALRSPDLIQRVAAATPSAGTLLARTRHRLRDEVDTRFAGRPEVAAVLRAMLLGDRSLVEREEAVDFQKTGVFYVLVVAGLHVGALAFFLYWIGRKLRPSRLATMLFTLTLLLAYVAVIEQRRRFCGRHSWLQSLCWATFFSGGWMS